MKNRVYVFFIILILTLLLLYFFCYETKEQRRARLSDELITFIDQIDVYNEMNPRKELIPIPAYCISSEKENENDPEEWITQQLKRNFQRFQLLDNYDQKAAIYAAYKNGEEMALIMNDQMYSDMINIVDHSIKDIIKETPTNWDILDLYTSSTGKILPKKIGNYLYQQLNEDEKENEDENIAYIINRKGMEKMLFSPTSQCNRYGIYPGIMIPKPKPDSDVLDLSTEIADKYKSKLSSVEKKKQLKELINNLKSHNEKVGFTCDIPCPVYYINMDKDVDRRDFMERQIEKMPNVHFTRITGFNGYAIVNKRNDIIKHDHTFIEFVNKYDDMSKSEIGCTMSHLIAIKKAYKNGDEIAMICEDDILFDTCTLIKPIAEMINEAPKNWEILQLSSFVPKEMHIQSKDHPHVDYVRNNGKNRHYNTACYLINRNGMETILKMTSSIHLDNFFIINKKLNFPSSGTADNFIYELCVTYTIFPIPFTVDNTDNDSTIHTDHTKDHIMYSINVLSKFNEIKPNPSILNLIIYDEKSKHEVEMKKIVEKYLKRFNFVTFYFICYRQNQHEYIEIENNCIYIKGNDGYVPEVLDKTIIAIDYCINTLKIKFDYFVRSNISSIINFNMFPSLPTTNLYTGPEVLHLTWTDPKYGITEEKLKQIYGLSYVMGSCIILSKDMTNFLLKNKSKLDRSLIDDVAIGLLFKNKKILSFKFSVSENNVNINSFYTRNKTINDRNKDVERMQTILDISEK